ncbi:MAG: thioredoxin domain-containing protein, partial [Methylobacteriaceae bacterium]|nr:thioredoxin domain-containing protein [Methylobacteriaceae bacterium]
MASQNLLGAAVSPYLLQHKENPVHWRPWGPDALAEAARTQKPILLSVGYAACHWCHVMAHESFEDEATAALMNELFVNIKVDREERPDVDHLYMSALQALGQHGGWPLTMFLTSAGEPFWGGTYFPKEALYGRASFTHVLRSVAEAYRREPERVRQNAQALREALDRGEGAGPGTLTPALLDRLAEDLARSIDRINGGIGGAPKFPNAPLLMLLWRGAERTKSGELRDLVALTLERICQGGIHDHLGGGFARYSVDERWLVPHFEKMLYDNAQLLELLALAHRATGRPLFAERASETVAWLGREMTTAEGAFSASLDADSEGVEGKFYVWQAADIERVLGLQDAAFFARFYDVTPSGNWHDEHTGETVTILNRLRAPEASAEEEERLAGLRARLLAERGRRIRPGLDDKVLADWNGLMIAALVNAATALGEPAWVDMAARAFAFIARSMTRGDRLGHAWRAGKLTFPGFASDYAAMIGAALALHEASGARPYLDQAIAWARALDRHHLDPASGLLFQSADDVSDLPTRLGPTADEAVPNAHGVFAAALVRLAAHTGDEGWRRRADALIAAVAKSMGSVPLAHGAVLNAFDFRLRAAEIV